MKKNNFISKYHPYLAACLLTLLSFVFVSGCENFTCMFEGRGYPFAYYNNEFIFWFFLADLVIWWVVYMIVFIIFKFIQNPRIFTK